MPDNAISISPIDPPSTIKSNCPFCAIAAASPPEASPLPIPTRPEDLQALGKPTVHTVLSTPTVLAFLDHAPISRGHTLLVVRSHREKLSDVSVREAGMLGTWMGVLSRAVLGAVREAEREEAGQEQGDENKREDDSEVMEGDWNVVQNNGTFPIFFLRTGSFLSYSQERRQLKLSRMSISISYRA